MRTLQDIFEQESFVTIPILQRLTSAHKALAELKWVISTIPNSALLISTLWLKEAQGSSAIENIITTHDEVFQYNTQYSLFWTPEAKEVHTYAEALWQWYAQVKDQEALTLNAIIQIQSCIEKNNAWVRKQAWTVLKNEQTGEIIHTPPQDYTTIMSGLSELEAYINIKNNEIDPLILMAVLHHQFECIHPFYDGNGRTWRIINSLYLVLHKLLDSPILYMSKVINEQRQMYYTLLQNTTKNMPWAYQSWVEWMVSVVELTAVETLQSVRSIQSLMKTQKQTIKSQLPKIYSHELLATIFKHPYTKIQMVMEEIGCSRITATRYLNALEKIWVVHSVKIWKEKYYINQELLELLGSTKL